jgi:RimJ/RimL family protein N-acetyltransferase
VKVPALRTQRLHLRAHRLDDFDALHRMWVDPLVHRYIVPEPPSREQNWSRLIRYAGHWSMLGYGFWVAIENETGHIVGELGFADFHRDIDPPFGRRIEMGWILSSPYHGRGFGTEALGAVIAWGEKNLENQQWACIVSPENVASLRLASRFGFQKAHETIYHGDAAWIFYRG